MHMQKKLIAVAVAGLLATPVAAEGGGFWLCPCPYGLRRKPVASQEQWFTSSLQSKF